MTVRVCRFDKEVGERFLHRNWPHTVKVGGKIFEEIRAKKPENTDIQFVMSVITKYKETLSGGVAVKNVDSDVFNQVVSSFIEYYIGTKLVTLTWKKKKNHK